MRANFLDPIKGKFAQRAAPAKREIGASVRIVQGPLSLYHLLDGYAVPLAIFVSVGM